ncbi:hypothetical protein MRX96_037831 [Rhipicephalus microplus]
MKKANLIDWQKTTRRGRQKRTGGRLEAETEKRPSPSFSSCSIILWPLSRREEKSVSVRSTFSFFLLFVLQTALVQLHTARHN